MLTGVIFCDSDSLAAKAIRDVTKEPESHVALLFGNVVLHYRFLGFESMHIAEFEQIYKVGCILAPPVEIMVSDEAIIKNYSKGAYDFLGMIYVGIFLIFRDIFGLTLPGGNYWQEKRDKFCVEFAAEITLGESGSMTTPTGLKNKLLEEGWSLCKINA
jgi:hypothetical protein